MADCFLNKLISKSFFTTYVLVIFYITIAHCGTTYQLLMCPATEAYTGCCPGGGLKILPEGQKIFWVSPPLEKFEPPPELLKLT